MSNEPAAAFPALLTPLGQHLLARATTSLREEVRADPLRATTSLRAEAATWLSARSPGPPSGHAVPLPDGTEVSVSELVGQVLTQVRLRARAEAKFGAAAARLYFTPDGVEQATRAVVAEYRAARFAAVISPAASAARPVADLCCGIGADLLALARRELNVVGVEADTLTAAVAAANIDALGLGGRAAVREGDVTRLSLAGQHSAVFCDPARRGARGRVFDPRAYSPPWDTVLGLAREVPAACVKAAPGIPHEALPEEAGAEWISVAGEVKEAALWFGDLRGAPRQATLLPARPFSPADPDFPAGPGSAPIPVTLVADPSLPDVPVAPVGRYLYEPDGAVIRAGLVKEAAARVGGALLDSRIAYVTSDRLVPTPFCRGYEVTDLMPFSLKRLRSILRERGVGTVTIKKRGSAVDVDRLRRDLRLDGPGSAVVILTRIGQKPVCLLCSEVSTAVGTVGG